MLCFSDSELGHGVSPSWSEQVRRSHAHVSKRRSVASVSRNHSDDGQLCHFLFCKTVRHRNPVAYLEGAVTGCMPPPFGVTRFLSFKQREIRPVD